MSGRERYMPLWQASPAPLTGYFINVDIYGTPEYTSMFDALEVLRGKTFPKV